MRTKLAALLVVTLLGLSIQAGASPSKYPDGFITVPAKHLTVLVSYQILVKTIYVHNCEEREFGWHVNGPLYFGGLGWLAATWTKYRASSFPPSMNNANPQQQAWAMAHFVGSELHGHWPDAGGRCSGGY